MVTGIGTKTFGRFGRSVVRTAPALLIVTWAIGAVSTAWPQQPQSQQQVTQQLSNPVGDLWMIVNQFNISNIKGVPGDYHINTWNLQPVLPVHLTKRWNLINRPLLPFLYNSPAVMSSAQAVSFSLDSRAIVSGHPLSPLQLTEQSGMGDIGFVSLLSPSRPPPLGRGQLLWGLGPTFLFPTASQPTFGFDKWQAGPSAVLAYLDEKWVLGTFVQQFWSFAGNPNRPQTNFAWIQYFVGYQFAPGWQVSLGTPIISVDWRRKTVSLPVGIGLSYTSFIGKLPVQLGGEYQKTVVHPDNAPYQGDIFRFYVVPVIPPLFGGKPK